MSKQPDYSNQSQSEGFEQPNMNMLESVAKINSTILRHGPLCGAKTMHGVEEETRRSASAQTSVICAVLYFIICKCWIPYNIVDTDTEYKTPQ